MTTPDFEIAARFTAEGLPEAERARQVIREIREELAKSPPTSSLVLTLEQQRRLLASVGGDFDQYKQALSRIIGPSDQASAAINQMIGRFAALGKTINVSSKEAVAAFRAEGDELAVLLSKLGATDRELNRIDATITRVEQRAGAAGVPTPQRRPAVPTPIFSFGNTANQLRPVNDELQKIPDRARTGANAVANLAFALQSGGGSATQMAIGIGSATTAISSLFGTARIAAAASGIGAIITVAATLIGLMVSLRKEAKETNKALDETANLGADVLRQRVADIDARLAGLEARRAKLLEDRDKFQPQTGGNELKVLEINKQIAKVERDISEETARRGKFREAQFEAERQAEREITDQRIRDDQETERSRLARIQGEAAAARLAAQQDLANAKARIQSSGAAQAIQERGIAAAQAKFAEDIRRINAQEASKSAEAQVTSTVRLARSAAEQAIAAAKAVYERGEAENEQRRAARQITERAAIQQRLDLTLAEIQAERTARAQQIDAEIAAQQKLLAATPAGQKDKRAEVTAEITRLGDERAKAIDDATAKTKKAEGDAAKEIADLNRRIIEAGEKALVDGLVAQGQIASAAAAEAHKKFDDLIKEADAAGDTLSAARLRQQRDTEIAEGQIRELEAQSSAALSKLETDLTRIQDQVREGTVSQGEAAAETVQAYQQAGAALLPIVRALEALAQSTGDEKTLAFVEQLKNKLRELGIAIGDVQDRFKGLKDTARGAAESALSNLIGGAADLITGGNRDAKSQVRALAIEIDSTKKELEELLAIPSERRTGEQNQRISELRNEIAQTSVALDNAKQAITGWRDLFLHALQSVAQALIDITSRMLALGLLRAVFPTLGFSRGGFVPGAGSGDIVDAKLEPGEVVINKRAVRAVGAENLLWLNANAGGSPEIPSLHPRHFASGGLVQPASPSAQTTQFTHRFEIIAPPGFEARHLDSPEGHEVVIKIIGEHPRAVGAVVSPFVGR